MIWGYHHFRKHPHGVSELVFFWPPEAIWIFRESINFFNPIPTETRVIWDPWVLQNLEAFHVFVLFLVGWGFDFFKDFHVLVGVNKGLHGWLLKSLRMRDGTSTNFGLQN